MGASGKCLREYILTLGRSRMGVRDPEIAVRQAPRKRTRKAKDREPSLATFVAWSAQPRDTKHLANASRDYIGKC